MEFQNIRIGTRIMFNKNYCRLIVKIIGFLRGQIAADMRGIIVDAPNTNGDNFCMVRWENKKHSYRTNVYHLERAETTGVRYLNWIEY